MANSDYTNRCYCGHKGSDHYGDESCLVWGCGCPRYEEA